jgi:hypothetical protein
MEKFRLHRAFDGVNTLKLYLLLDKGLLQYHLIMHLKYTQNYKSSFDILCMNWVIPS